MEVFNAPSKAKPMACRFEILLQGIHMGLTLDVPKPAKFEENSERMTTSIASKPDSSFWNRLLGSPHFLFALAIIALLFIGFSQIEVDYKEDGKKQQTELKK